MSVPNNIIIDDTIPLYIFWHIFIDEKGYFRGKQIIQRQFEKIKNSGLLDRCEAIYICYVSSIKFPCEDIINNSKVKILIQKESGYEGVTTTALKNFCDNQTTNSIILYIHNRGISHSGNSPSEDLTLMMEYFVINKWKNSIKLLEDKYTCGCELASHDDRITPNKLIFHYSGNFWFARSEYIKLLPFPTFENRYVEAEDWILQKADHGINKEYFGILHRTSSNRYERGMVHFYIDRYPFIYYKSGKETPDIEIDKNKFHGTNCVVCYE
jgi:hypothetical protein